jgi:hypothetical protein
MAKKLSVGDVVICRYINTPDNKFYGDLFAAEIISPDNNKTLPARDFTLMRDNGSIITLWRKEIKHRMG